MLSKFNVPVCLKLIDVLIQNEELRSKLACVIAEREEYKRDYQKLLDDNKKREEVSIVEFQITVLIFHDLGILRD